MDTICCSCRKEYAKIACNCKVPSVLLCESCLPSHITSQKSVRHTTEQMKVEERPIPKQIFCSVCSQNEAQILCLCKGVKTRLCHGCIPYHMSKNNKTPHPMEQLEADDLIDSSNGSLQKYLERKQVIDFLINEAGKNLVELYKFKSQATEAFEEIQSTLSKCSKSTFEEIDAVEKQIEDILEHLEDVRYERSLNESDWAHVLVAKARHSNLSFLSSELKMVSTQVNISDAIEAIQKIASLTIVTDPTKKGTNIPYFRPRQNELILYKTTAGSVSKHSVPKIRMKEVAGWTTLPSGQIFYCGGCENNQYSKETYLVDPITLEIKQTDDMKHARAFPALIYHKDFVYSFGGYTGTSLKYAEKYSVAYDNWTRLPDMPIARSAFSIVEMTNKFFLAGDSPQIDVYDVHSNSYSQCHFKLPQPGNYLTVAAYKLNLLIFLDDKVWSIDTEKGTSQVACQLPKGKWWSQFPPIVKENEIYFCRYDDTSLWMFEASKQEISKVMRC